MSDAKFKLDRLDHRGIAALLKSGPFAGPVDAVARAVADRCGGEVESYTTDRRAALVKVPAHRQAKGGDLIRAAHAVGLEVRQRS